MSTNIVVPVKHVPDAQKQRTFQEDLTVDRGESILSELDEYPLEAAIALREAAPEAEVTIIAVTVGPEDASGAVKKALQMGADAAFHVADDALAGLPDWLVRAMRAAARERGHRAFKVKIGFGEARDVATLAPVFAGLRGGVGRLPGAVAAAATAAGVTVRTGATVRDLVRRPGDGWHLVVGSAHDPELVAADDVSLVVRGETAEALREVGVRTVAELAALDPAGEPPVPVLAQPFPDAVTLARAWRWWPRSSNAPALTSDSTVRLLSTVAGHLRRKSSKEVKAPFSSRVAAIAWTTLEPTLRIACIPKRMSSPTAAKVPISTTTAMATLVSRRRVAKRSTGT